MQLQKIRLGSAIVKAIAAALLFDALGRHKYDYFTLLRWIACGVCTFTAVQAVQVKKFGWVWIFAISAIILNPVAPLRLKRETWNTVDTAAGVLLLIAIAVIDIRKPLSADVAVTPPVPPTVTPSDASQALPKQRQPPQVTPPVAFDWKPYSIQWWLLVLFILGFAALFVWIVW
jgi:hypothetical protein